MEKSGRLLITQKELDLFNSGELADSLIQKGVKSYEHLLEIITSYEYDLDLVLQSK
jgi:hypothetical protein